MSWGAMSPAQPLPPARGGGAAQVSRAARAGGVVFDGESL